MTAYPQLMQESAKAGLGVEVDEWIDEVVAGTVTMSRLIQDLLTYCQATHGFDPDRKQGKTEESLVEALHSLQPEIAETKAQITWSRLPEVFAPSHHLTQIFQSLISNSIKYRRPHELPRICISATDTDRDYVLAVADNGMGFNPEHAERVFGLFKRLHGATIPGTGVGLAIAKTIVNRHGGRIWAVSEPQKGTTIFFSFPNERDHGARNGADPFSAE